MLIDIVFLYLLIAVLPCTGQTPLNQSSIHEISTLSESFKVTSIQFNHMSNPSEWVDRILGPKSIFFNCSSFVFAVDGPALSNEEKIRKHDDFKEHFSLHSSLLTPSCSFEILSYGLLDQSFPITREARNIAPSVGYGDLSMYLDSFKSRVVCYYRGLYENWRPDPYYFEPYWPIVVYCPIISEQDCQNIRRESLHIGKLYQFHLEIKLSRIMWRADFKGRLSSLQTPKLEPTSVYMTTDEKKAVPQHTFKSPKIGLCLAIPYTTLDNEKLHVNRIMLTDWIRYYTKMDFVVLIYDRDGVNYDSIYNNGRYPLDRSILETNLIYFNYTINGILDPSTKGMRYDNSELNIVLNRDKLTDENKIKHRKVKRANFEMQGYDKTLTLTHCRFEAKAVHGIDTVIVADYDEFLYCPQGGPSAGSQAKYIKDYVNYYKRLNIDQITFQQRFIQNRTESTRACIIEQAKKNQSLFNCLAPFSYYVGGHSVKSIHIGHKCPLTGYHHSCPTSFSHRLYDCVCASKDITHIYPWTNLHKYESIVDRECGFVHLSMNDKNYVPQKLRDYTISYNPAEYLHKKNEIGLILD